MTSDKSELCAEVEEGLSQILDGTASARLFDHLVECDGCRDLRHEASLAAERVVDAGADFRPADESVVVGSGPVEPGAETAATMFDPLAAAKAEEDHAADRSSAAVPAGPTREATSVGGAEAVPKTVPPASDRGEVVAATQHGPLTAPVPALPPRPGRTIPAEPAAALLAPKVKPTAPVLTKRRLGYAGAIVGAFALAAGIGTLYFRSGGTLPVTLSSSGPWSGAVSSVARASADKSGGLEACTSSGACSPVADGASIPAGTTLRTDSRTRAHVTLADSTDLALDRGTEVELSKGRDRTARVKRGTIVADVTHQQGTAAHFAFARGEVEVIGTKLAITADEDRASVEVARGAVRVTSGSGKTIDVRAGEEATLVGNAEPVVASSSSLADVMEWSDVKAEEVDAPVLRGLGELRARTPGQTKEKDHAVRLSKHAVKVRIVDVVARTEVDETFTNDTDEELEGIFRFPLPPGAQIERLSLEVDGKMIDGAFVDRDKGAAIWRGVIQNAAPKSPRPREEIIWVPGPWRDPALLEWQRGGRFELKIFPIPRRGSRRVQLTYTQAVEQAAGIRRFTYPLAHDPSGTTKVDSFDLDVQVLGRDRSVGLSTRGYELASASGDGDRRTMHAEHFVPAGDLTVEYALPDRDKEVTAWAYQAGPAAAPVSAIAAPVKPQTPEERAAAETANAILDDRSPYVAIAVRPHLPRWQEAKERLHVIVVDSSRSMVGERFTRATKLASSIVREMDRRDSFVLLACDTLCKPMAGQPGGSAQPSAPGASAAGDVERFLGSIEPDGGSDLAAAMSAARTVAGGLGGKELRVVYLGDGTPSVGPTKPAHLEAAVRGVFPAGSGGVVAVALGADADTTSLEALARGGGGVVVPYVPGQRVGSAALDVLGAAYGVVLRDPEVELPAGLSQVTPSRLDPIRAGGETLLVARMTGGNQVAGQLKLKGRVAGEKFEQSYPIRVLASTSGGNAFVPRLYAAAKIAELERLGGEAQKPTVIELSKRFAVASRFTSLLVLESEAMFNAFGLDRHAQAISFTGEQQADSSSAEAEGGEVAGKDADPQPGFGKGGSAMGRLAPAATAAPAGDFMMPMDRNGDDAFGSGGLASRGPAPAAKPKAPAKMAAAAPAAPPDSPRRAGACGCDPGDLMCSMRCSSRDSADKKADERWSRQRPALAVPERRPPPPRNFVPMRRVWDRKLSFDAVNSFVSQNAAKVTVAESALAAAPDSRDKTVELFALYSTSGRLGEAQDLTARWSGRDALDPDALVARADLAARQGDRERAVRILGGLADVRPNDQAIQARLADLHDAAGQPALACEHRIALADIAPGDAKLVAAAVGCARAHGQLDLASVLRLDATDKVREAADRLLANPPPVPAEGRGDVTVNATWSGGADLDVALIDAQGRRTSWLGSPTKAIVTARDAGSTSGERLNVANLPQGNYVVEITRAAGRDSGERIQGEVTVSLGREGTRRVPFVLTGARAEIGTVRVFFTSRLEPVSQGRWNDF